MGHQADLRRRWLGAVFLAISLFMLIAGETVLERRLSQSAFLTVVFWTGCFASTLLAIFVALLDLAVVRRRTRAQQRELLDETLNEIIQDEKTRAKKPGDPSQPSESA